MKRAWSVLAVALLVVALLFEFFPRLDLAVSGMFYRPLPTLTGVKTPAAQAYLDAHADVAEWRQRHRPGWSVEHVALRHYQLHGRAEGRNSFGLEAYPLQDWAHVGFVLDDSPLGEFVYQAFLWGPRLLLFSLGAVFVAASIARVPAAREWRRRAGFVLLAAGLGQGILVDVILKEHWGRARPNSVQEFSGTQRFSPPLRPTDQCDSNCSFPSGHAAGAFALIAFGAVATRPWRRRWLIIGLTTGTAVGVVRIMQGAHYLSDVIFGLYCTIFGLAAATLVFRLLGMRIVPAESVPVVSQNKPDRSRGEAKHEASPSS